MTLSNRTSPGRHFPTARQIKFIQISKIDIYQLPIKAYKRRKTYFSAIKFLASCKFPKRNMQSIELLVGANVIT